MASDAARVAALLFGGLYLNAADCIALVSVLGAVMNAVFIVLVGRDVAKREGGWKFCLDFLCE